ncbi:MAG: UDP-glucose 4-epimerase GalE [Pseudomonadota bacterium]
MNKILVTGGAGYIGSHVVKLLVRQGAEVVVLDNLSKGFAGAVIGAEFVHGNTGDRRLVKSILGDHGIDTVMHFAAYTVVPESVANPGKYYQNNTFEAATLMECCVAANVSRFVFSSTAATYGVPEQALCSESAPTNPINPYGHSKLMAEQILRDFCAISPMQHAILRYFNVAGADPEGEIGQTTAEATLLIKVACEAALGLRDDIKIFGTDFPTRDGTGVRDYIHVVDLATAHLAALDYLESGGSSITVNCGYGHGFSVREVLDVVAEVHGKALNVVETSRRPGDPAELIADNALLRSQFNWQPAYDDLKAIVRTTYDWQAAIAAGEVVDGRRQA